MTAKIIDGKKIAEGIKEKLKFQIEGLTIKPCLAVILVGNNPASNVYVNMKEIECTKLGIILKKYCLKENLFEEKLLNLIKALNNDVHVHGILVQLPLPSHIDEFNIIEAIEPKKDVDGFHAINMGCLFIGTPKFEPCTPKAIIEMINSTNITIEGKHAVIVGRSKIVGNPVAQLLLQHNTTVTICHSKTHDLKEYTKQAYILVVAVGIPHLIKEDMIKEGAIVIDVGVNRIEDITYKKGYYLCGDVDFEKVINKASYISPVPGGVGPVTIAMLMSNTLKAYHLIENGKAI